MRELEEQIRDLADATFARTQPASLPAGRNRGRGGWRYGAVAAAAVVVITSVVLVRSPDDGRLATDAGSVHLTVDDPVSIDLDDLVERSDRSRLRSLGPFLTFDFDGLGSEWETTLLHAITTASPGRSDSNGYWQQTRVQTPTGRRLVVNVQGPLVPGNTVATLPETQDPTEPITVRDEPGRAGPSWIEWIEQDRITVQIVPGPGSPMSDDLRSEMLELAEQLEILEVPELQWSTENAAGTPMADSTAQLSGALGGTTWKIVSSPDGTTALAVSDRLASSHRNQTPEREDLREIDLNLAPISVPGGTLVWGFAPSTVKSARLILANGDTAQVTTVESTNDRSIFAVPIADDLDPISVEFLNADGGTTATYNLRWLPPYMGGSISTTIPTS